jgi:phosphonate transport system permease protein
LSQSVAAIAAFERERAVVVRRRRLIAGAAAAIFLACLAGSAWISGFAPGRVIDGFPRITGFFEQAFPDLRFDKLFADTATPGSLAYWFYRWPLWTRLILESIEMAILATAIGGAAAFFLSFIAARNIAPNRWLAVAMRRLLELFRTLPDIVIALLFVFAFGIGPAAGVLAIALHTTGALGKLMSEVHENIDMRPLEGVKAAGGSWAEIMRFGVVPQILPNFVSYALLRFEINVASASAIGFVGAGGIGQEFYSAIQQQFFPDALAIMLMVVGLIFIIDLTSEFLRHRVMGLQTS